MKPDSTASINRMMPLFVKVDDWARWLYCNCCIIKFVEKPGIYKSHCAKHWHDLLGKGYAICGSVRLGSLTQLPDPYKWQEMVLKRDARIIITRSRGRIDPCLDRFYPELQQRFKDQYLRGIDSGL